MAGKHTSKGRPEGDIGSPLDELVRQVSAGAGYREMSRDLIAAVGARELARRPTLKEAVKATRSKLHQVAGAYFARQDYDRWLDMLADAARTDDPAALKSACLGILHAHASTRERLPILDVLYERTLGKIGPIQSVLDVACGLNPLTIPWMPLASDAEYRAYDVYSPLAAFLNAAFPLLGVRGTAEVVDVTAAVPPDHAAVALLLKTLPCLEQLDRTASARLLEELDADHLLVTYPVRSLGGRSKGMIANYDAHLRAMVAGRGWQVTREDFATELAYLIVRNG
jgi:16S rRNA (guanine(1405)-N(7))-methyltransferase